MAYAKAQGQEHGQNAQYHGHRVRGQTHWSNMKWARGYIPQDFPPGITLCVFNRPPHRGNWA
eukprot:3338521-Lingulodinium_polyedra.AAC.1